MEPLQAHLGRLKPHDSPRFDHEFEKPIKEVSASCNCTAPRYQQGLPVLSVSLVAPAFSDEFRSAYSEEEMQNGFEMKREMRVTFMDNSTQVVELNFTLHV